jgi:hypothetical protein
MAIDYRIAVAIALSSNHNMVLSALSAHLLRIHTSVGQLTGNFNRLKLAIGGALAVGGGVLILETMTKLIEKTKEYSDELVKLESLGGAMGVAVRSGDVTKRAFDISQRVPMKVTDIMKIPGASYSILGMEDSEKMWEKLARFQFVMSAQKDFKGDAGLDLQKFLRSGELGGRLTDPTTHKAATEELDKFLDLSTKVMAATHGMVTPSTLLGMSQQAGFSMRGMTDEGFMNMAIMAQAMGGPRAGTAMLSLYNQVATGKMTKQAAAGMQDLGLLSESEWSTAHGQVTVNPAAKARLGKLLGKNPMEFVDQIYENLEKQGITDPQEQQRRVAQAMSRQTSERFVIEQMMNREQMKAERERMAGGLGSDEASSLWKDKSVGANLEALKVAWENLQMAVAGPNSAVVIQALQALTGVFNSMQLVVTGTNPKVLVAIAETVAAIGVALVAMGAVTLAVLGGLPALIAAVAAAIVTLAALNWDKLKIGLGFLNSGISGLINLLDKVSHPWEALPKGSGWGPERDETGKMKNPGLFDKWLWGDPSDLKHKSSFDPGTSQPKTMQTAFSFNVDGRVLAQTVIEQMESLTEHATGAPAYNGQSHFARGDGGMAAV